MTRLPAQVLVVEDNPVTRTMIRATLVAGGYQVIEAPDGQAAIAHVERALPDLVLQDLLLPDISGVQLVARLHALPGAANVPVLALTGFMQGDEEVQALSAGFNEYLVKPIEPVRLLEVVRAYVGGPAGGAAALEDGKRILVVDDDPGQLALTRMQLQRLGYAVQTARDGIDALETARASAPDAIVSDVLMPRLDGFKLCRAIRLDPALGRIPVVLQSNHYAEDADRELARRLGANAYVTRTTSIRSVAAALRAAFAAPEPPAFDPTINPDQFDYPDRIVRLLERQAGQNTELLQRTALQGAALAVLGSTADALARREPVAGLLEETLYRCIDVAGVSVGVFYEAVRPSGFLARTVAGSGPGPSDEVKSCFGHPQLLQQVLDSRSPLSLPTGAAADAIAVADMLTRLRLKKCLLVPVVFRDEALGVLLLASSSRDLGAPEWIGFGQIVSGQIGQALTLSRAFEEVRSSEALLHSVIDGMSDPMFVKGTDGRFQLINAATAQIFGVAIEDVIDRGPEALFPPDAARIVRDSDARVMEGGVPVSLEETLPTHAQGTRTFLVSKAPRRDASGAIVGVIGVAKDITEMKRADEMIRRLSTAVAQSPAAVIITDPTGRIEYVNRKFTEITGYPASDVIGQNPRMLKSGHTTVDRYGDLWSTITRGATWRGEIQNRRRDGEYYWASATIAPVKDETGTITHFVAIQEDVTEAKRAQGELQQSETRYRAIIDATFDGILVTRNGSILEANRGFAEMLGYDLDEVVGKAVGAFVAPESRADVQRWFGVTGEGSYEIVGVHKDGRKIQVEAIVRNITHDGEAARLTALRNVTERRTLEEQLRQAQKMEAVGRLAGGVAHDFNNLLTVITSYGQLMLEEMGAADPRRADLGEIQRAATAAATLTRQLLAFSRQQVLEPRVLGLNDVLTASGKMLKRLIGEDVELAMALAPELANVKADPGQIEQVIMNLAVNARDAMPDGGKLTIETANVELDEAYTAVRRAVPPGRYVVVSVSDTGVGMDEATKARLFEPFFTTKETGKGTGLGLATVYGIVKQSGGFIWVYSELGHGSTFKVYLPQVADTPIPPVATLPLETIRGTETILLAEDAAGVRTVANEILKRQGYNVLVATDGRLALDVAAAHPDRIHLLVTDVIMPEMSGRQLADRLKEQRPDIKVLFVSGYTDDAIVRHGMLEPGIAFLQKPFSPQVLARKVREVLG